MKISMVILAISLLLIGCSESATQPTPTDDGNSGDAVVKEIRVKAERFTFTPSIIEVKKGEPVKIIIENVDTAHGLSIPDFGASGKDSVEFTPDKTGEFTMYCANFCGSGHTEMQATLKVIE